MDEDGNENLPSKIDGKKVSHIECDLVVGEKLVLQDDEAEVTVTRSDLKTAKSWRRSVAGIRSTGMRRHGHVSGPCSRDVRITSGWVRSDHEQHLHGLSTRSVK